MSFTHFVHSHQTEREKEGEGEENHPCFIEGERSPPLPSIVFFASATKDMHLVAQMGQIIIIIFFFISFMRKFLFCDSIAFWVLIQLCCYKIWILLCFLFWICETFESLREKQSAETKRKRWEGERNNCCLLSCLIFFFREKFIWSCYSVL